MSGSYRGFVRVIVTLIAGVLVAAGGAADEPGAPKSLSVENDSLDLGRIVAGSTASATFVLHNDGARDVKILRAAPS